MLIAIPKTHSTRHPSSTHLPHHPNHLPETTQTTMKSVASTPLERELVSCLSEHPMSLPALKKTLHVNHEHTVGFEAVLAHALERMCKKHVVAHVAGHPHTFRLSKAMAAKVEKTRAMRAKKAVAKKPAKKQGVKAKAGKMAAKKKMMAKKA